MAKLNLKYSELKSYCGTHKYKSRLGVSGETAVLIDALSRGEILLSIRYRLGRIGEIDLITYSPKQVMVCYEVRTIGITSLVTDLSDRISSKKIKKLTKLANLLEMYHVKLIYSRFFPYSASVIDMVLSFKLVVPIIATVSHVTSESVPKIDYFDMLGDEQILD